MKGDENKPPPIVRPPPPPRRDGSSSFISDLLDELTSSSTGSGAATAAGGARAAATAAQPLSKPGAMQGQQQQHASMMQQGSTAGARPLVDAAAAEADPGGSVGGGGSSSSSGGLVGAPGLCGWYGGLACVRHAAEGLQADLFAVANSSASGQAQPPPTPSLELLGTVLLPPHHSRSPKPSTGAGPSAGAARGPGATANAAAAEAAAAAAARVLACEEVFRAAEGLALPYVLIACELRAAAGEAVGAGGMRAGGSSGRTGTVAATSATLLSLHRLDPPAALAAGRSAGGWQAPCAREQWSWQLDGAVVAAALGDGPSVSVATRNGEVHVFRWRGSAASCCPAAEDTAQVPGARAGSQQGGGGGRASEGAGSWVAQRFICQAAHRQLLVSLPGLGARSAATAPPPLLLGPGPPGCGPGEAAGRPLAQQDAFRHQQDGFNLQQQQQQGRGRGVHITVLEAPPCGSTWHPFQLQLPQTCASPLRAACLAPRRSGGDRRARPPLAGTATPAAAAAAAADAYRSNARVCPSGDGPDGPSAAAAAGGGSAALGSCLVLADSLRQVYVVDRWQGSAAAAGAAVGAGGGAGGGGGSGPKHAATLAGPPSSLRYVPPAGRHSTGLLAALCSDLQSSLHLLSWPSLQPLMRLEAVAGICIPRHVLPPTAPSAAAGGGGGGGGIGAGVVVQGRLLHAACPPPPLLQLAALMEEPGVAATTAGRAAGLPVASRGEAADDGATIDGDICMDSDAEEQEEMEEEEEEGNGGRCGEAARGLPGPKVAMCGGGSVRIACFQDVDGQQQGGQQQGEQGEGQQGEQLGEGVAMDVDGQGGARAAAGSGGAAAGSGGGAARAQGLQAVVASLQQRLWVGCEQVERLERSLLHKVGLTAHAYSLVQQHCFESLRHHHHHHHRQQQQQQQGKQRNAGDGGGGSGGCRPAWQLLRLWAERQKGGGGLQWAVRAQLRPAGKGHGWGQGRAATAAVADARLQLLLIWSGGRNGCQLATEGSWRPMTDIATTTHGNSPGPAATAAAAAAGQGGAAVEVCAWVWHQQVLATRPGQGATAVDVYAASQPPAAPVAAAAGGGTCTLNRQQQQQQVPCMATLQFLGTVRLGGGVTPAAVGSVAAAAAAGDTRVAEGPERGSGPAVLGASSVTAGMMSAGRAQTDASSADVDMTDARPAATTARTMQAPPPAPAAAAAGSGAGTSAHAGAWQEVSTWLLTCRSRHSMASVVSDLRREACGAVDSRHHQERRQEQQRHGRGSGHLQEQQQEQQHLPDFPLPSHDVIHFGGSGAWPALAGCTAALTVHDARHAELALAAGTWQQLDAAEACLASLARSLTGVGSWQRSPLSRDALARLEQAAGAMDEELEASIAWLEERLRWRYQSPAAGGSGAPAAAADPGGCKAPGPSVRGAPGSAAAQEAWEGAVECEGIRAQQRRTDLAVAVVGR